MSKIELKDFKSLMDETNKFRLRLFEAMGDELYEINKVNELIFFSLDCIADFDSILVDSESVIEQCALKVLEYFQFGEKERVARVFRLTQTGKEEILLPSESRSLAKQWERYLYWILNLEKAPAEYYLPLKKAVEKELIALAGLIEMYESFPEIIAVKANGGKERNHHEKTLWDFYQRCILEQKEIWSFYLTGIKKRALSKASVNFFGISISWLDQHLDHPYRYGFHYNESYFDYRKIEKVKHRFTDFPDAVKEQMAELYRDKKVEYYERMNEVYPPLQVFNEYDYYLAKILSKTDRREIFKELKTLYKNKNWFGFYALALTQVEGLFTEMQRMIENKNKGSLPEKVNVVRQGHPFDLSLDYYEYYIPYLRNRFLHVGHDREIEWKAVDLFYDLSHILRLFCTLDSPFQKLLNLINDRKPEDFFSIEQILAYFSLIEDVKKRKDQFEEIKDLITKFEKEFLAVNCDVDFQSETLIASLKTKISNLDQECREEYGKNGVTIDIEKMNYNQLKSLMDDEGSRKKIEEVFYQGDKFVELIQAKLYLEKYKNWLPSLPKEIQDNLDLCYKENKDMLSKINLLYSKLKPYESN